MKILVIGAAGFIGSAVVAALSADGHDVAAGVRRIDAAARRLMVADIRVIDLARHATPAEWAERLAGVMAVVNCAGTLQDGPGDSTSAAHDRGPAALWEACTAAGIRRIIHFSAIGVDRAAPTAFSASKQAGDAALASRDLDWVILRPSVVVGPGAYGGSALFRGLAALPVLPVMPGTGPLQIVTLDDVVATVLFFLQPQAPTRLALDLAGPDVLAMTDVIALFRRWLGLRPVRAIMLPRWGARMLYAAGDLAGRLGWRPPMRSNAGREILRGAIGDATAWRDITGIVPHALADDLRARPASVQERWFARLYLLKPAMLAVFSSFWIATACISVGPGYGIGTGYMLEAGAGRLAGPSVVAGALADFLIGAGIAFRRAARPALVAALAISLFYAVAGTILLPRLWLDPLGPMTKIWPIMALNFAILAILDDR